MPLLRVRGTGRSAGLSRSALGLGVGEESRERPGVWARSVTPGRFAPGPPRPEQPRR